MSTFDIKQHQAATAAEAEASEYAGDERVTYLGGGNYKITERGGFDEVAAVGWRPDDKYWAWRTAEGLRDDSPLFDRADDAIRHLIGDPQ